MIISYLQKSYHPPSREKVAPFLDDLGVGALGGLLDDQIVDVDGGEHHQTEWDHVDGRPDQAVQRSGEDHVVLVQLPRVCFPVQVGRVEHLDQNLVHHYKDRADHHLDRTEKEEEFLLAESGRISRIKVISFSNHFAIKILMPLVELDWKLDAGQSDQGHDEARRLVDVDHRLVENHPKSCHF